MTGTGEASCPWGDASWSDACPVLAEPCFLSHFYHRRGLRAGSLLPSAARAHSPVRVFSGYTKKKINSAPKCERMRRLHAVPSALPRVKHQIKSRDIRANLEVPPRRKPLARAKARFLQTAESYGAAKKVFEVRRDSGMRVFGTICGAGTGPGTVLAAKYVFERMRLAEKGWRFEQDVMHK